MEGLSGQQGFGGCSGWMALGGISKTVGRTGPPQPQPPDSVYKRYTELGAPFTASLGPTAPTCFLPLWAAELHLNCPRIASSRVQGRLHILRLWRSVSESKVTPLGLCPACVLRQEKPFLILPSVKILPVHRRSVCAGIEQSPRCTFKRKEVRYRTVCTVCSLLGKKRGLNNT